MNSRMLGGLVAAGFALTLLWAGSARAQLFQNNNFSCEDKDVVAPSDTNRVYVSSSVACGRFNDDSALGNASFPDCATMRDPIPALVGIGEPSNSILINTGAHGQNCLNAGDPNAQFQDAVTLTNTDLVSPLDIEPGVRMGTIRAGNLDNGNFEDLAMVTVSNTFQIAFAGINFLFSNPGGGFGSGNVSSSGKSNILAPDPSDEPIPYPTNFETIYNPLPSSANEAAERSLVLLDCDGDGLDEGAYSIHRLNSGINLGVGFLVAENSGAGLEDASLVNDFFALPIPLTSPFSGPNRVSLASGDFNGDNLLDIVAAVDSDIPGNDAVVFCAGDGACGFTCPTDISDPQVFNLSTACGAGCNPIPTSIIQGDFDGNGLLDVAVVETARTVTDLRYLFNNGQGIRDWVTSNVLLSSTNPPVPIPQPWVVTAGKFSEEAFATNTDEAAVSVNYVTVGPVSGNVAVITSDGNGGLNNPLFLEFTPNTTFGVTGLEASDFDHCGGDDIIALGHTPNAAPIIFGSGATPLVQRASLFLNANEAPVVTASVVSPVEVGVASPIIGACTDPTNDDRTFQWSVVGAPAGANVVFSNPSGDLVDPDTDVSTNFTADVPGDYIFQVDCADFCGEMASTTVNVTVTETAAFTQGANIFNCSLGLGTEGNALPWLGGVLFLAPLWIRLRRRVR